MDLSFTLVKPEHRPLNLYCQPSCKAINQHSALSLSPMRFKVHIFPGRLLQGNIFLRNMQGIAAQGNSVRYRYMNTSPPPLQTLYQTRTGQDSRPTSKTQTPTRSFNSYSISGADPELNLRYLIWSPA